MFYVHRSNRMEELRAALCRLLSQSPLPPFQSETIVVSSQGMERWLAMGIAQSLGVSANAEFPFPRAFVERVLDLGTPDSAEPAARFSRESLRWALLGLVPELSREPALAPVRAYVEADERGDKTAGFAERVAYLFDQYVAYRPELPLGWEAGSGEGWQPVLWRALVTRFGAVHVAARARDFVAHLASRDAPLPGLPPRVSLFGTATLPPVYLEVLAALSRHIDVHAFLLCPSDRSWRATRARREEIRALPPSPAERPSPGLGASLGRVERDFQAVLEAHVDYADVADAPFVDPGVDSALAVLQSDLLQGRVRGDGVPKLALGRDDRSISIHVCHSPMRELEVLRDQLLDAFQTDPSLRPEDVIVMMPDVETYGPYVEAVFGSEPEGRGFIPYRLTDQSQRSICPLAEALLRVLEVLAGRVGLSDVTDLLQLEAVQRRFGFEARDLPRLTAWMRASGARSCIDASHRQELGLAPTPEHTWRFGLNRLLLGYALPGEDAVLFEDVLPLDALEGGAALAAGQLGELVETLAELRLSLAGRRTVRAWRDAIVAVLEGTLRAEGPEAWQERVVREALDSLVESAESACFAAPIERAVFVRALEEVLSSQRSSHDFMAGGVTFSALLPMRSIPFRIVCLVGMNDGEFPRALRAPAFDEMAKSPRVGDRNVRDDDRHSFLEALLSARERLIVTYVGRGIQDDGLRPPSVVLSELIETLTASFDAETSAFVLEHPLQAFSERYFDGKGDPRLFSYSTLELAGAKARAEASFAEQQAFTAALAVPHEPEIDLEQLCAFFEHPVRALFERECSVRLRQDADVLPDREPIQLSDLERFGLGSFLLARQLAGAEPERAYELARAAGLLPHGALGRVAHARESKDARVLSRESLAEIQGGRLPPLVVDIALGERRLVGVLRDLYRRAQVLFTFSRGKARTLLSLWIRHLSLCIETGAELPRRSVLVSRGRHGRGVETWELGAVEPLRARELLAELVALRDLGRTQPLCLFPEAAFSYVGKLRAGGSAARTRALAAARASWERDHVFSGANDAYHRQLFGERDPLSPEFELSALATGPRFAELAPRVFDPVFEHLEQSTVLS